jgi:nucleoside-diphosphate-sugar epimerase
MGIFEQWVPDPRSFERVNAEGASNVVIAAREGGARRVVHTSTFDVFAADRGGTVRETALLRWEARADSSKAREELGVEFTPWREGIRRTVAWMLETGRV